MAASGPDKQLCNGQRANQPKGVLCTRPAGWGTDHPGVGRCKRHGGSTSTHRKAAEVELARRECVHLGIEIRTTPGEALIHEVWEAAGNVAFYRHLVQQLPIHPEPDEIVPAEFDADGHEIVAQHWKRGDPGIYGRTYHVSGMPTGEAKPHVLLVLYNQERDRLKAATEAALRANVEERLVLIAEADATRILAAQVAALRALGLEDRLEDFRDAFTGALRPAGQPARLGAASPG